MPGRVPQMYLPRTTVDASPAAAVETIICTFAGIDTVDASSQVFLQGQCNVTVGVGGTAIQLRIRQTSLTGTIVGNTGALTGGIAAGNVVSQDLVGIDAPGIVASMVYVMTLQVTAATGASTVSAVTLAPVVF